MSEQERIRFPNPGVGSYDGIVATGANLSPGVLLSAYEQGIFPWFSEGDPLLWWSPDPRFILLPSELHVPRRVARRLRTGEYRLSFDTAFSDVIQQCSEVPRPGQDGTWITSDMIDGYIRLHELGFAHSVEAWRGSELAGGLYGVSLGRVFFGESMFAAQADASKVAFVSLVRYLSLLGFELIDCQVYTEHLDRFGAREIPRTEFLSVLGQALSSHATLRGNWGSEARLSPRPST
ncbi:MAG: leucyl/phenylalanyl-tRNA--protein transferase [Spirochaetaceae bacterium]|nr:MAG: leucyl/phenylalanyl-tRNA--protein transferase [Spirochaetaceae bacterium]